MKRSWLYAFISRGTIPQPKAVYVREHTALVSYDSFGDMSEAAQRLLDRGVQVTHQRVRLVKKGDVHETIFDAQTVLTVALGDYAVWNHHPLFTGSCQACTEFVAKYPQPCQIRSTTDET